MTDFVYLLCVYFVLITCRRLTFAEIDHSQLTVGACSDTRVETACGSYKKCWVWRNMNVCYRKCQRLHFKNCNGVEVFEMKQTVWRRDRIRKRSTIKTMYRYKPGYDPHPPHDLKQVQKLPRKYVWDMLHSDLCEYRCVSNVVIGYNEHCGRRWLRRRVCYLSECVVWNEGRYCKRSGCVVRRVYNKCFSINAIP